MARFVCERPRLPGHYRIRFEPPDQSGEEVLVVTSERRRIKLKGRSFREFLRDVAPLLDGRRTLGEIQAEVAWLFSPAEIEAFLKLLADCGVLQDAGPETAADGAGPEREPQLNFFHELGLRPREVQARLAAATVAVWGLGGPGAAAALALAAAGIGNIRCVDALPVSRTDPYLAPAFSPSDVGRMRSEVIGEKILGLDPRAGVRAHVDPVTSDSEAAAVLEGADFLICCADMGMASQFYILNRACLRARIPWTSCAVSGFEGLVGPTVVPGETACYLCYKMRAVGCAGDPEDEFAHQRSLDRRKQDDSGTRENHPFGVAVVGNLAGLEAFHLLTGLVEPPALGRIVVVDLVTGSCSKHDVLRKPWCPACFPKASAATS